MEKVKATNRTALAVMLNGKRAWCGESDSPYGFSGETGFYLEAPHGERIPVSLSMASQEWMVEKW